MARGVIRLHWDIGAIQCWLAAEPNRNKSTQPEPFTPQTFHPLYRHEEKKASDTGDGIDWGLWNRIKSQNKVTVLTSGNASD